jgi:hypothetical protein
MDHFLEVVFYETRKTVRSMQTRRSRVIPAESQPIAQPTEPVALLDFRVYRQSRRRSELCKSQRDYAATVEQSESINRSSLSKRQRTSRLPRTLGADSKGHLYSIRRMAMFLVGGSPHCSIVLRKFGVNAGSL